MSSAKHPLKQQLPRQ